MRNKLIEIMQEAQGGNIAVQYGDIADALIAADVIKDKWVPISEEKPKNYRSFSPFRDYLCTVLIPVPGGSFRKEVRTLSYDPEYDRWNCEDMIVTHWMSAIQPAE